MDAHSFASARAVHSKLQEATNNKGVAVLSVFAVLIVIIIVLAYYVHKYKNTTSSFGNHSMWHLGSGDSGSGGSLSRDHASGAAVASRQWAQPHRETLANKGLRATAGAPSGGACAPGETAVSYSYPARQVLTGTFDSSGMPVYTTVPGGSAVECVSSGARPDIGGDASVGKTCGRAWDPAAVSEVQALATVGGFQHDSYGEAILQSNIDAAPGSAHAPLSDSDLESIMHHGGSK